MKVQYEISEQLYKKFQAALVIQEENEDDVMSKMISDYLSRLFARPFTQEENRSTIPQNEPDTLTRRVNPFEQKKRFIEWFKEQTYRGRQYNPVTISGYSGRIENACQSPEFSSVSTKNLFEIADITTFREVRHNIEKCEGFSAFDAASHSGFTAALNMYDRFLCAKNEDSDFHTTFSAKEREVHSWTYAEDELCCRRFFEIFVVGQRDVDLTRFSEALHRELPSISIGSLKMKTQNIKYLCEINGITNSLSAKTLNQYSAQCKHAFNAVRDTFQKTI